MLHARVLFAPIIPCVNITSTRLLFILLREKKKEKPVTYHSHDAIVIQSQKVERKIVLNYNVFSFAVQVFVMCYFSLFCLLAITLSFSLDVVLEIESNKCDVSMREPA